MDSGIKTEWRKIRIQAWTPGASEERKRDGWGRLAGRSTAINLLLATAPSCHVQGFACCCLGQCFFPSDAPKLPL